MVLVAEPAEARFSGTEPLNGNQELIAHPSLPYIYYGGNSEVTVYNYQAGTTDVVPLSGASAYVNSMDISADGTRLAASCGSLIFILALSSGVPTSSSSISSVGGNVQSLCFGAGDAIYVSYEASTQIDTYTASGYAGNGVNPGKTCILEADESRNTLLAVNMGSASDTVIIKYDISGGSGVAPSETGRSGALTGKLAQFEVASDKVYMACTNAPGIQVISLSSLTIESIYAMQAYPSGVAISRDNSIIYGVSAGGTYATGQSVIYAFDPSGEELSIKYVGYQAGPVVPTANSWVIGTISPLQLETIGPDIEANAPAAGSSYTYSPGYIRFNITHYPAIDAGSVTVFADGQSYPVVRMDSDVYQINLTSALSAGDHTVSVSVPWGGTTVSASWSFTSGSTGESALRPSLSLIDPAPDSNTSVSPTQIVLEVDMPAPRPYDTNITITVNNFTLSAVVDPDDASRYIATLPSSLDLMGTNIVTARADVDGFIVTGSWEFVVSEEGEAGTSYEVIRYGDNFTIPSPVAWTEQRDSGEWELVITGPSSDGVSTKVYVDIAHDTSVKANQAYINTYAQTILSDTIEQGDPAEMVGEINYTAISDLTAGVWKIRLTEKGVQEAYALIVDELNGDRWLIKCTASDTSFIDVWPVFEHMISGVRIVAPGITPVDIPPSTQGYAYYRMLGDYQLMVPDNWTIKREAANGDTTVSLKLTGPKVGDFYVTILLQNGTDPAVQDDQDYLLSLVQSKFLPELEAKGIEATVYEQPRILSISNHTTLVFSIKWTDLQNNMSVVQEIYYIVDEESHRYWMFTCEAPEGVYPAYAQIFDKVAQSFTPLDVSSTTTSGSGLLSDPTAVLMIVVLAITGAAAAIVFVVVKRFRPRT